MLLQRFEDQGLSHYSYAIGCPQVGRMAIIDPRRDTDVYINFASDRGMSIAYVLETHIHADYASGALQLAEESGAELCVSGYDEGEDYTVRFPHTDLLEGDSVEVGTVRLEALHTPGHTPEHLSLLAYDESRSRETPVMLFSGDFLFVGSVGRPDLLGEAVKEKLAAQLFWSIKDKLDDLPDGLEIHPAHGAGSLCGAGMGSYPSSTLGFERASNPYLDDRLSRASFCEKLLAALPPRPSYYIRMKALNSEGPPILEGLPGNEALSAGNVSRLLEKGHRVLDVRAAGDFGAGHLPGSISIGLGNSLSPWAGWILSPEDSFILVLEHPEDADAAIRALIRVGLDRISGYLKDGTSAWADAGYTLETTAQVSVRQLHRKLSTDQPNLQVLDVRTDQEWKGGHVESARHCMLGDLPDRLDEIPEGPLAIICGSGYRSSVAASLLQAAGRESVSNVTGGMTAWMRAGLSAAPSEVELQAKTAAAVVEPGETGSTPDAVKSESREQRQEPSTRRSQKRGSSTPQPEIPRV